MTKRIIDYFFNAFGYECRLKCLPFEFINDERDCYDLVDSGKTEQAKIKFKEMSKRWGNIILDNMIRLEGFINDINNEEVTIQWPDDPNQRVVLAAISSPEEGYGLANCMASDLTQECAVDTVELLLLIHKDEWNSLSVEEQLKVKEYILAFKLGFKCAKNID